MNKVTLEQFIQKYGLRGAFSSVTWESEDGVVSTSAISRDADAYAGVSTTNLDLPDGKYHIVDTIQLRDLIYVLPDEIDVKVLRNKSDEPVALKMSGGGTFITFYLSDPAAIPNSAKPVNLPSFEQEIYLSSDDIDRFLKAQNALPDVRIFTIKTTDDKTQLILGYDESLNTNNISMNISTNGHTFQNSLSFSALYLREMLMANKDSKKCTIKVSSKGLAQINFEFENNDFSVEYYLMRIKTSVI